jgi:hypothetical protein
LLLLVLLGCHSRRESAFVVVFVLVSFFTTMPLHLETTTIFGLGLAGLLSLGLSVTGFLILGIGEACCHLAGPGGLAFLCFACFLTLSVVVVVIYALWTPPQPLIVWLWAIAIITALEVMTFRTCDPAKNTTHNLFLVFLGEWTIPQVWLPFGVAALCQLEASKGRRTPAKVL